MSQHAVLKSYLIPCRKPQVQGRFQAITSRVWTACLCYEIFHTCVRKLPQTAVNINCKIRRPEYCHKLYVFSPTSSPKQLRRHIIPLRFLNAVPFLLFALCLPHFWCSFLSLFLSFSTFSRLSFTSLLCVSSSLSALCPFLFPSLCSFSSLYILFISLLHLPLFIHITSTHWRLFHNRLL